MQRGRLLLLVFTILATGTLTACGRQNASQQNSQSETSQYQAQKNQNNNVPTDSSQTATLWNQSKNQQLANFIHSWAPTMHQSYEAYDGTNELKTSVGTTYPADLSREQVNGQAGVMGWAPNGKGDYEYNVVAIYNYNGTKPPLPNRITYFFCFHHGKPVALVDQSRDGEPSAHPTVNQEVADNFERIANSH